MTSRMLLTAVMLAATAAAHAQTADIPLCNAKNISFTSDTENGNFDATSHSGTLLVMRNFGNQACSILPKPRFDFADKAGNRIALDWAAPPFMHPGPVEVPVVIPVGAEVTARMTWVSGPVYDHSACIDPASIALYFGKLDGGTVRTALTGHMCGPAGKPVTYVLEPFRRDPAYKP